VKKAKQEGSIEVKREKLRTPPMQILFLQNMALFALAIISGISTTTTSERILDDPEFLDDDTVSATPTEAPTLMDIGDNPTMIPTTMMPPSSSIIPSLSPVVSNNATTNSTISIAPSMVPTLAPSLARNATSPTPRSVPPLIPEPPPVNEPTESPTEPPNAFHDKKPVDGPKDNTPPSDSNNDSVNNQSNNGGISAGAIFAMVFITGAVFVLGYFVFFGGRQGRSSSRRDGMREMEMSTWVNNNDNDGLL
jgi:hypothetical protein